MEIPGWLKSQPEGSGRSPQMLLRGARRGPSRGERFLDNTLDHVLSFIKDTMFNETISARKGLLQNIGPRLKLITFFMFVFALSLQKTILGIAVFFSLVMVLLGTSGVPPFTFVKRLLPSAVITLLIASPVILNLVVEGDSLLVLFRFSGPVVFGPVRIPREIAITAQGLESAATLLLRVVTSVSLVFLLTMTTRPNAFIKALSSIVPGSLTSVVSISYRYIFFLLGKIEQSIMGLKSRHVGGIRPATGRQWVASRMGLLFSISMELSNELAMAMESRGYRSEEVRREKSEVGISRMSLRDLIWLIFTISFCWVMVWKSFA